MIFNFLYLFIKKMEFLKFFLISGVLTTYVVICLGPSLHPWRIREHSMILEPENVEQIN
jgi:hypothetical protein